VVRCQQDVSLAQVVGELHTTIDAVRRLVDEAGIHRSSPKVRSARERRRGTDQHLTKRAGQLGFGSLEAYLIDRVARRAWTLVQVASELGVDRNTVRDRWTATSCALPGRPHTNPGPTLVGHGLSGHATTSAPVERIEASSFLCRVRGHRRSRAGRT
jgi:hypothetical protein